MVKRLLYSINIYQKYSRSKFGQLPLDTLYVNSQQVTTRTCNEVEANFRGLTRSLLTPGGLQNKEVKDFFLNVTEKICEPLRAMQVSEPVDMAYTED